MLFDLRHLLAWLRIRAMPTDADKLREIAARLELSQRALADELEVPERDLRHLFAGRGQVPKWLWLALEALELRKQA